jgi:hypothetical protein
MIINLLFVQHYSQVEFFPVFFSVEMFAESFFQTLTLGNELSNAIHEANFFLSHPWKLKYEVLMSSQENVSVSLTHKLTT